MLLEIIKGCINCAASYISLEVLDIPQFAALRPHLDEYLLYDVLCTLSILDIPIGCKAHRFIVLIEQLFETRGLLQQEAESYICEDGRA